MQVASYEFTTLTCIPGVVRYRGAKIQLLDLPGIIEGAKDGKGRGRQVCSPGDAHPFCFRTENLPCTCTCSCCFHQTTALLSMSQVLKAMASLF